MTKITTEVDGKVSLDALHKQSMKVHEWVKKRIKINSHLHIKFNRSMAMAIVVVDKRTHLTWKVLRDDDIN